MQHDVHIPELKAQMARRELALWQVAQKLGISPSSLSSYLNGQCRSPASLRVKLEQCLGLEPGELKKKPDVR